MVHVPFAVSLVNTIKGLTAAGIECQWRTLSFSSFIQAAREKLAREFWNTDYTDLVFIDDDMSWEPEGFARLLSHDVDVVGAICPRKRDNEWNVNLLSKDGERIRCGELLECAYIGTAFIRIRRGVVEKMPRMFDAPLEGGRIIGEDAWFCREWRRMGGRVWADPEISVGHLGIKEWRAKFGDSK